VTWNGTIRQVEQERLRCLQQSTSQRQHIVFIMGPTGSGKSSLVINTFSDDANVIFAHAKFDQNTHSAPVQKLNRLLSGVCSKISASQDLGRYLRQLKEEFNGKDAQQLALTDWLPEMDDLFADTPVECPSLTRRSRNRETFQLAVHSFLKAISTVKPLVFCLDDIMWSDEWTLSILFHVFSRLDVTNILWCATCRHDELEYDHPFMAWKRRIEDENCSVDAIKLNDVGAAEVKEFLSCSLKRDDEMLHDFATLMHERTNGNLFFLVQTLEALQDLYLLYYDYSSFRWKFSVEDIRRKTRVADNVGDLLTQKITHLPRDVLQVLKLASCFGNSFDIGVLQEARSVLYIFNAVDDCLKYAVHENLLIQITDKLYRFAHDNVKNAAHNLLPDDDERQRIHWDIGMKLSQKKPEAEGGHSDEWFFAVSDQLKLAGCIMHKTLSTRDRVRVAGILHIAGESASRLSAFGPSSQYYQTGITFLGGSVEESYRSCSRLATQLYLGYSKAILSLGKVEESRKTAQGILVASTNEIDKRHASLLLYQCSVVENDLEEQINVGFRLLQELGVKVAKNPACFNASVEYDRAMKNLKAHTDDDILSLPPMSDNIIEMSIDVLCSLIEATSTVGPHCLVTFLLARLIQLTLEHGLCKYSPLIMVLVGRDRIAVHSSLNEGHEFVKLGLRLQQVVPTAAEVKGALLSEACMALGCVQPLAKAMHHGLDAYQASMVDGDTNSAFFGVSVYLWSFFYSGLPFAPLLGDVEQFATQMLEYRHIRWFYKTTPIFQLLLCLSGQEDDNHDITSGRAIQMNSMVEKKNGEDSSLEIPQFYGLQLAMYMGDEEKALVYYEQLKDMDLGLDKASSAYHVRIFFFALVCIQEYRRNQKGRFKNEAKRYIGIIRALVEEGAINLPHKLFLLEAEIASLNVQGESSQPILRQYERAIVAASRAGFQQDGAISQFIVCSVLYPTGRCVIITRRRYLPHSGTFVIRHMGCPCGSVPYRNEVSRLVLVVGRYY